MVFAERKNKSIISTVYFVSFSMNKNKKYLAKTVDTKSMNHFQMLFKEVKQEEGKVKIKGFASTPDLDRYDDIVQPTAFAEAMATYMKNPVVLLGHDSDKPIGTVTEYNLSTSGLEVTVEVVNNIDDCMEKIQNKTLRGFSIGWRCLDCIYKEEGNKYIREVTKLDLAEISVVAVPANPSTLFTLSKSLKKMFDERKEMGEEETTKETVETSKEETPAESETPTTESTTEGEESVETTEKVETTEETPAESTEETPTDDAPADTSEVVKADEEPSEEAKAALLEEVKALVSTMIDDAVEKACGQLLKQNTELNAKYAELEVKHNTLEADFLKIEVRPGSQTKTYKPVAVYPGF